MELTGGEVAGEDRLSELPDDVLVQILLRVDAADTAARTSVLSRRWRRVWALLPVLFFGGSCKPHLIGDALGAHQAALLGLSVETVSATPDSVAAWLPVAAPRLAGLLIYENAAPGIDTEEQGDEGAFELPCFEKATIISLDLGFLGLSMPPAGVFTCLTNLSLKRVRFDGPFELGDTGSSLRCPCLLVLKIHNARGLLTVTVCSESLHLMELCTLQDLEQLTVAAPLLCEFSFRRCFALGSRRPIASIVAPQLELLHWEDFYHSSSVHLGKMEHLQSLGTYFFAYGSASYSLISPAVGLLLRFKALRCLTFTLFYPLDLGKYNYLMEHMTMLPDITSLHLIVIAMGHAFGATSFHVLGMCSGITSLKLTLPAPKTACPSGCICGQQPPNWKTEGLLLNCLQKVEINYFSGLEHEVTFVKRLFIWATVLKKMIIVFDCSVTKSMAEELFQMLLSFSKPDIHMEYYIRAHGAACTGEGSKAGGSSA
ncbi:unnamed protein product [Urochloa decumbens]|uniref:F-box domain-containing protein n=1 Tax=Urochloa decumbens TaxID=240449 RepID=A0ABC9D9Z4_9POAL